MKYDVNILALVRQYTPVVLRKAKLIALLDSMTHPLRWLQSKFATYRESVTYRLSITSQVCYLQKLLNDRYDNTDRRIYISDGNQVSETYIYLPAEDIPVYIYSVNEQQPHHIYLEDEIGRAHV